MLAARGIDVTKVRVSRSAHVIMPYHVALDRANEARLAGAKVGHDRARHRTHVRRPRVAPRACGWRTCSTARSSASGSRGRCPDKNLLLEAMGAPGFTVEPLVEQAVAWGERLRAHLDDTTWLVQDALRRGDHVLLEGAQGTLLDLDHGSYPFVTSSNPVAGGACTGGGIGPLQVDEVIGVMKAYSTRVGSGPFPTELFDDIGARDRGARPRVRHVDRAPAPRRLVRRRAAALRGRGQLQLSAIMLNKLDILSGIETIRLCVAYEIDGRRVETWPSSGSALSRATPDLRGLPGLGGADPRRPLARRPARERPALRDRARGARRRPDRPRRGRPGADADDRAGLAADAPPPDDAGLIDEGAPVSLLAPTRILVLGGGGREHALAWKLAAEPGMNEVVVAPGSAGIAAEPRVRVLPVRPARRRRPSSRSRAPRPSSSSSSGPRRRSPPVSPTRCSTAGIPVFGPTRRGGPDRELEGVLPRGRRGGRRPDGPRRCVRRPRAGARPARASSHGPAAASSSRPTASPPARA